MTILILSSAVAAYIVIGSFVFTIGDRWFGEDGDPFTHMAGMFWPLVLPVAIVVLSGRRLLALGAWLGRKRVRLPKAQVRKP